MVPVFGGVLALGALAMLVFAFKGGGAAGGDAPAGSGVSDAPVLSAKEAKQRYMAATSVREIHRFLSDAVDKRIADSGRKGLALTLEQAGSQMKPGEWAVMTAGTALVGLLAGTVLVNLLVGIVGLLFGGLLQRFLLKRRVAKRKTAFETQLPEALQLISGGLRAGQSLTQALANVANDAPSPSGDEYRRVLTETRLGRDLTEALYAVAERMDSEDFEWVVGAIDINRTTGGDLSVILDRVTETTRQRDRLRGQVRTLSAEGRLSGWVVGLLPPGVFCFVYMTNREYMATFFESALGYVLLAGAGLLLCIGALWLRKIAKPIF